MNDDNEFICCECGTVVDEEEGMWSFEQIKQIFVYDFNSETLVYEKNIANESTYIEDGEPTYNDNWKDACSMLWEAIIYPGDDEQELIKKVFDEFKGLKALLKLVRDAS